MCNKLIRTGFITVHIYRWNLQVFNFSFSYEYKRLPYILEAQRESHVTKSHMTAEAAPLRQPSREIEVLGGG